MSRSRLLNVYKQLLSECEKFTDYNFRSHALRKVKYNYEKHLEESDPVVLSDLISKVENDVKVIQRQVVVGQLYAAENHILDKY